MITNVVSNKVNNVTGFETFIIAIYVDLAMFPWIISTQDVKLVKNINNQ